MTLQHQRRGDKLLNLWTADHYVFLESEQFMNMFITHKQTVSAVAKILSAQSKAILGHRRFLICSIQLYCYTTICWLMLLLCLSSYTRQRGIILKIYISPNECMSSALYFLAFVESDNFLPAKYNTVLPNCLLMLSVCLNFVGCRFCAIRIVGQSNKSMSLTWANKAF